MQRFVEEEIAFSIELEQLNQILQLWKITDRQTVLSLTLQGATEEQIGTRLGQIDKIFTTALDPKLLEMRLSTANRLVHPNDRSDLPPAFLTISPRQLRRYDLQD